MIGLKNSYEIAYNGTENECRFELYADTSDDLQGLTHFDGIKIQMGSECTDIATGDKYILNGSGAWILQPKDNAFTNVYTKAEIDNMSNVIYQTMLYYHTAQESSDGSITFYTLGTPVSNLTIYGNGQQTGTPTPDAPIQPEFVGTKTANLFNESTAIYGKYINSSGVETISATGENNHSDYIPISAGTQYTISETKPYYSGIVSAIAWYTNDKQFIQRDSANLHESAGRKSNTFTAPANAEFAIINFYRYPYYDGENDMLNIGNTALPYEPFGYKIPISCGGTTVTVYTGDPLRKALDGSNAVDVLSSAGTITREVDAEGNALATPITQAVDVPEIPTTEGQNTLTVDTDLIPGKIVISGGE